MTILIFFITILILVLIHEFGHFFAAKKFNIKVLEFGFGIPPKIFGKKWGETLVSLNWLPFGGFVRLLGEDDNDPKALKDKRSFASQHVLKRIIVVLAGVAMNLSLAWVLFWIILASQGFKTQLPLLSPHQFVGSIQTNEKVVLISSVSPNSPADQASIKPGERLIAFNSQTIGSSSELIDLIKQNAGEKINLTLSDVQKKSSRQVEIIPRKDPPEGEGPLGVSLGSFEIANLNYDNFAQKILAGPLHSYNLASYSMEIFAKTIQAAIAQGNIGPVSQTVAGPVGITALIGDIMAVKNPLIPYLEFLAMLSLNLAIINVLPFPGLDGGRLVFLLWEALTRKKVSPTVEKYIHSAGLIILIGFIILVTESDIKKLL